MAKISKKQENEIKRLAKRAQARYRASSGGQRRYIESQLIRSTGTAKISASTKGLTSAQANAKIRQLERFLSAKSTTKKGWKEIGKKAVASAGETWRLRGYTISDEELADILIQVDTSNIGEYYRAVNLVQAAKDKGEEINYSKIGNIIAEKVSAAESLKRVLKNRK